MLDKERLDYFRRRLAETEQQLADFDRLVATRQHRIWRRDLSGEEDVTGEVRANLERAVREYQSIVDKDASP
jgi:hypothetical protein